MIVRKERVGNSVDGDEVVGMGDLSEGRVHTVVSSHVDKHVGVRSLFGFNPFGRDVTVGGPGDDGTGGDVGGSVFIFSVVRRGLEGDVVIHSGKPGRMVTGSEAGERGDDCFVSGLVEHAESVFTCVVQGDSCFLRRVKVLDALDGVIPSGGGRAISGGGAADRGEGDSGLEDLGVAFVEGCFDVGLKDDGTINFERFDDESTNDSGVKNRNINIVRIENAEAGRDVIFRAELAEVGGGRREILSLGSVFHEIKDRRNGGGRRELDFSAVGGREILKEVERSSAFLGVLCFEGLSSGRGGRVSIAVSGHGERTVGMSGDVETLELVVDGAELT